MSVDPRTPVIVGVAQVDQRPVDLSTAIEPYKLMANAVHQAIADTEGIRVAAAIEWVGVVQGAWSYTDPARLIADEVGLGGVATARTAMGGQAPQAALNTIFARIKEGKLDAAVLTGGETIWSRRRLRRVGQKLASTRQEEQKPDETLGRDLPMSTDFEKQRGAVEPIVLYPVFESAVRANRGESLDAHRDRLSRLWVRFNEVAAANPHAWRRESLTAEQIRTPSSDNRMVGFPYTKAMNSNWDLDQASATVVCSVAAARRLSIPSDRWVFPLVGAQADDTLAVSNRRDLHSSPAIAAIGQAMFEQTGLGPDDIDHVDLYSCFPSAVQIGAEALGLSLDRPLTVTGGLTFAGGPLNNYVGHSVAAMTDVIRHSSGLGLVTGNGGYITKHAAALYGSEPPTTPFATLDAQVAADRIETVPADPAFAGRGEIEGYTVMHDAEGPTHGVLAVKTPTGGRTWARCHDSAGLDELMAAEGVGRTVVIDRDGEGRLG